MNFHVTDEMNPRSAAKVVSHLREPRLWIPTERDYGSKSHSEWLEKTEAEIAAGTRYALMASFGRTIAGVTIFRPEPNEPSVAGIRNISINPAYEGRYVGAFLLRNTELLIGDIQPTANTIIVDTKITNTDMLSFLDRQRYQTNGQAADLYGSGKADIVLTKSITPAQDEAIDPQPYADRSTR